MTDDTINPAVIRFASGHMRQTVGRGECFDLADEALRSAGALSAADYGEITATADYEWGLAVMLQSARPGDIVQFRNYRFVRETTIVVRNAQNQVIEEGNEVEEATRPHHTAIIQSVSQTGEIVVYEQNADGVRSVASNPLYLLSRRLPAQTTRSGGNSETRTTNITVSGTYRIFRPQPRE